MLSSGERKLQVKLSLVGVEVGVCGGDLGEVMSASVTGESVREIKNFMILFFDTYVGLETQVDMYQEHMQIKTRYSIYIHLLECVRSSFIFHLHSPLSCAQYGRHRCVEQ